MILSVVLYGYETVTLGEKYRLRVLENRDQRGMSERMLEKSA
jgi:hypothetical protein